MEAEWVARLEAAEARTPRAGDRVWKDECAFSFLTPESASSGLFLNLVSWQAFAEDFVRLDHERTGQELYLYVKWSREEAEKDAKRPKTEEKDEQQPTKLAIGVDGGFSPADELGGPGALIKEYGLVMFPDLENILPFPNDKVKVPQHVAEAALAVIAMDDAGQQIQVAAWDAEDEPRPESKFARTLEQLDNGIKISADPKTWKCADSGMTSNLWLNLSTGYIGSGRRNWDGSGGTGAALRHFEETGKKYPLCVKLGTITAEGADVYSYDPSEDGMVTDPLLEQHLAHWGIKIGDLRKTEKTMLEMEIDMNNNLTLSAVLEGGEELVESYGPGMVGLFNLGNSCYVNSTLQVLLSLAPFQERFLAGEGARKKREAAFRAAPKEPQSDVETQMVKLAGALTDPRGSGVEPRPGETILAVAPKMLKDALAKGHRDFAGREQQDAREYLQHVLDALSRLDHRREAADSDPGQWFSFLAEERLVCEQSRKVQCKLMVNNVLLLTVPPTPDPKPDEPAPLVSLDACLAASLNAEESLDDYLSPATNKRGTATKATALATFPRFLAVQMKRYTVGDDWVPKKIECRIPVPRELDLTAYRAQGMRPGDEPLPEASEQQQQQQQQVEPDAALLAQLVNMGFNENGCKRALIAVQNAGAEAAMSWVLEHMGDPDFESPPETAAAGGGSGAGAGADPASVSMLAGMGFSEDAAALALRECGGDLERAADWLFSHAGEIDALLAADKGGAAAPSGTSREDAIAESNDGPGKYLLRGFISHLGKTTTGGHYLCHVNKSEALADASQDRWVIMNDRKVALSKNPPFEHGFLYVFERVDTLP